MEKEGAQALFLQCYTMGGTTDERQNNNPHELEQIMGKHSDIFQNPPHGLPPQRSRDHIINLIPLLAPIKKIHIDNLIGTNRKSKVWYMNY